MKRTLLLTGYAELTCTYCEHLMRPIRTTDEEGSAYIIRFECSNCAYKILVADEYLPYVKEDEEE